MVTDVISKPIYRILSDLTQEPRVEVALPLAVKDLIRLKLKETRERRQEFELRYGMDWATFEQAWQEGRIPDAHSYQVERDYWEWEAVVTDEKRLPEMLASLP
jgi:hypothetical protein